MVRGALGGWGVAWAAPLVALLCPGCRPPEADKPEPPDVGGLVAAYAPPTSPLDGDSAAAATAALESRITSEGQLCGWLGVDDLRCAGTADCPLNGCEGISAVVDVFEVLEGVGGSDGGTAPEDAGGTPTIEGVVLEGTGFVRITRICPGTGPEPVPDEANGTLDLVVGFTSDGIDPVTWGDAEGCLFTVLDAPVRLDGGVRLILGDGERAWLPRDGFAPVVAIHGELDTGGETTSLATDFRVDPLRGELSTSLELPSGDHLHFFVRPGAAGFRAADGEWTCDFSERRCDDGSGGSVSW